MLAHPVVSNHCVSIISLLQLSGSVRERSRAPAAPTRDSSAVDCHVCVFPCKMFFDSALAFVCFEFQALLRVSEQPSQDFAAPLLFVAVRGGGRSRNVTLSVSCVPQMFIFSFVQEKETH